jgi:rhodanese-related sulfurtransferase
VELLLDDKVQEISAAADNGRLQVSTSRATIVADLVVLAAGTRPNTALAREAGLSLGMSGGILVDQRMRTSDPHIYAGGDCIELRNLISGENMPMALGSLANRQGRVIATNLSGGQGNFPGTVCAFCLKVFDLTVSKAGLTCHQAKASGFDPVCAVVSQVDHAHFYPGSGMMHISLVADRNSRKILGIEAAGSNGNAVKARVDSVAVLLRHGVDVDEICSLETCYAPPYASAMDIINNAGNALDNILAGRNRPVVAADFLKEFGQGTMGVLDIRGEKEAAPFIARYGALWRNIPQDQLRRRVGELAVDEPLFLLCDTGSRSYEAQVFLDSRGITATRHIQGGFAMLREIDPAWGQI